MSFKLFLLRESKATKNKEFWLDCCSCSECGWKGKASDCEFVVESDGWENLGYEFHYCTVCEDGGWFNDHFYCNRSKLNLLIRWLIRKLRKET